MLGVKVESYRSEYFEGVKSLWREVFPDAPPWDAANVAIPAKLTVQPELSEARLAAMGCQKINLQVRASNAAVVEFYKKLGYMIEERISMGKRL